MRIAVLSDIHSNIYALEAVLWDVGKRRADVLLNLGDILYGPIAPKATYDLLMKHDLVTIRGNQDRQICKEASENTASSPTMQFVISDLGRQPLDWMRSLRFDCQLTHQVYLCHGSPTDDLDYLLEDVETGHARLRPEAEILEHLGGQDSDVVVCGHTHIPRTASLGSGQLIVNPGSVGLPAYTDSVPVVHCMENFAPHASYAILEATKFGWTVEHIKVAYDHQRAARAAAKRQRKDWVRFLTTGRSM